MESDDGGGEGAQKDFRITAAGQRELPEWMETPPEADTPPRHELVIKILVALRVPGVDVHQVVQTHRRRLVEVMQRYTHVKAEAAENDIGLTLVVDAELFRLEGVARWLDAADARFSQAGTISDSTPVDAPDSSSVTVTGPTSSIRRRLRSEPKSPAPRWRRPAGQRR